MTNYYYSRFRIFSFIILNLGVFLGSGIYILLNDFGPLEIISGSLLIFLGLLFVSIYRRIIVAVFNRQPALSITAATIQYFGTRKFTWQEVEYYRLKRGVGKSSIVIKLYDNNEEEVRLKRNIRSYFDKFPLISFNKNILIVDLTFVIGVDEYIVQTFEKYDLIGQENQRVAS
jgi:hypothetical protein